MPTYSDLLAVVDAYLHRQVAALAKRERALTVPRQSGPSKDMLKSLDGAIDALLESFECYMDDLARNQRTLPERYVDGDVVVHVHVYWLRGEVRHGHATEHAKPRNFCVLFCPPGGSYPGPARRHGPSRHLRPRRAESDDALFGAGPDDRSGMVLVDVGDFAQLPKRMQQSVLPTIRRLQPLDTCREILRQIDDPYLVGWERFYAAIVDDQCKGLKFSPSFKTAALSLPIVTLWDYSMGLGFKREEIAHLPIQSADVFVSAGAPFLGSSQRMPEEREAHAR